MADQNNSGITNGAGADTMNGDMRTRSSSMDDAGLATSTSPGNTFATEAASDDREGFANHPHITVDNRIGEGADMSMGQSRGMDMNSGAQASGGARSFDFKDFASRAMSSGSQFGSKLYENARQVPGLSRDLASRVDTHARSNPWMHIGLVSVGFLALGYLFGRRFSSRDEVVIAEDMIDGEIDTLTV
jgi:ElaB/YqjD/DUF883 family membrane-anchored ribosome-binding protein